MPLRDPVKLIVQIPCYNEADTLPATVAAIPRSIPGIDRVELLVIDDGSRDGTSELARRLGVEHVVRHRCNRGLARSFSSGIDYALKAGADIIVNTDGDNQYCGEDIIKLVQPILAGRADMVIGDRQTWNIAHFSFFKRVLQQLGSGLVRRLSATDVPDAVSGFRAFSRSAAMKLNVVSTFSYTIETLIQAGRNRLAIASVPVRTNGKTRPSRLFKNIPQFLKRSGGTMLRVYALHRPMAVFFSVGMLLMLGGLIPIARFLALASMGESDGHLQSLVLGVALMMLGGSACILGLLADLIAANRLLLERVLEKLRYLETQQTHLLSAQVQRDVVAVDSNTVTPALACVTPIDFENRQTDFDPEDTLPIPVVPIVSGEFSRPFSV